jgi:23S rRNA (cytidine1920-2'-O)/16S rRNA (cytidine1409-2'-O)-methyltransferase
LTRPIEPEPAASSGKDTAGTPSGPKQRLDHLLVSRGLAASREKAQALILAGEVTVNGQKAGKAGHSYAADVEIRVAAPLPYVSRGGFKLAGALDEWSIPVEGRVCADVGASTGGFTDCLLQRGARRVYAIDVGATQLDWKLRTDPRVVVRDQTNARFLSLDALGEPADLAVCDVSFISVTLILPAIASILTLRGEAVILIKPQFEAGREQVGKGGIVRDPAVWEAVCRKVESCAETLGFRCQRMESPILGTEGNKEFLLYGRRPD